MHGSSAVSHPKTSKRALFNLALLTLFALPSFVSFAQATKIIFEENKNQWPSQVMFKADIKGGSLFLEKNTFTYNFADHSALSEQNEGAHIKTIRSHSFKVNFLNSNPHVNVSGNDVLQSVRNYYIGNDPEKWGVNVRTYSTTHYQGLYALIDMTVYSEEGNLKYDLIVQPGGNSKNIKINYTGQDDIRIEYGHLHIKTSLGLIIEQKPYAYQVVDGEKKQIVCSYVLKNNTLSFQLGDYDASLPLIIDPTVIASTYSGSTVDNRGFTATYDAAGNIYTGGMAVSIGYPVTAGAFQQIHNGGVWDIVLSKFSPTGSTLLFSTYYGGAGAEQPHSTFVNSSNELYVVGRTNSTDFPVTSGVYQDTLTGLYDIIVGKVSSTGALIASTYIGGTGDDCINVAINNGPTWAPLKYNRGDDGKSEIILDANSNVYVAGCTQSTDFPTSAGAYDNSLSGPQDAVIFKMNSSLTGLTFSTYLGGSGYDAGYGLKTDNSNKIYVTGGTSSADFPVPVASVINPVFGGDVDGYIAVLDPVQAGPAQLLRSTFLGTALYDQSFFLEIDASGDLYVYGQTKGPYPVTPGVYTIPNSGMFIHKVTGTLASTVFSTVFGTGGNMVNLTPTAFLVDSCQTIYISGFGRCPYPWAVPDSGSTIGLPVTPNAFQPVTDGCDLYFAVLTPDAKSLYYATHYGDMTTKTPDHVDGGTSRFDKRGVVYHSACASCAAPAPGGFPTTPTAYSANNNGFCNDALVKMDVSVSPIAQANVLSATTGCAPHQVCFNNTGSSAGYYIWDFGDGGTSISSAPCYTYSFSGTYTITLYAIDSIGICGYIDTSLVVVTVGLQPSLVTGVTNILCNGGVGTASVTPSGGITPYTYSWSLAGGSANSASGLAAGNYTVVVSDAAGCISSQSVTITQPPVLTAVTTTVGATCGAADGSATVSGTGGTPGYSYSWSTGQTTTSATGLAAGTYSITVTDMNGCTWVQSIGIPVTNAPNITVTATSTISCNGGSNGAATATLSGGNAPYTYAWSPTSAGTNQTATGLTSGTYFVIITDAMGCSNQASVIIPEPGALAPVISHTNVICFGASTGSASATTTGGTGTYTYDWGITPAQTSQTATGLTAGSYTLLITDANGCTATATVSIVQPVSAVLVSTSTSGSSCGGNANGGITSTVSNGTPSYTYNWSPGGQTSANITNISGGTYTLVVSDVNGCTAVNITTLPTNIQPLADFQFIPHVSCEGVSYNFTSTSANALTHYWDIPGVGSSTDPNPAFVFPYNGTYTVTLIVTNIPCSDTASLPVSINDLTTYFQIAETNVFTPNADGMNDCFIPEIIGTGVDSLSDCIDLEVYDRWGVIMFRSIGADNCWNGNNRTDSKPALDGTYYYIARLGKTTVRGYVTLARHK